MPTYEHICDNCQHEWEDIYSIKQDPPKNCPSCNSESARRLISLVSNSVIELTGHDLVAKVKRDTTNLKKDMHKDEKLYANLLGEDRYQSLQKKKNWT